LVREIGLDLGVGVVDDGKEHVEENEEHKEDVEAEVGWTEDTVCLLQSREVKVTEDQAEQRETVQTNVSPLLAETICGAFT